MEWLGTSEYDIARLLFQRGLAAIYLVAFVVALRQFRPLLGERGLLPVPHYVAVVPFRSAPSLFHWRYSDRLLAAVAWTGIALSLFALAGLTDRVPLTVAVLVWLVLWALYLSIVNVGQTFYAFGWESLLCEAGFLAIFLGNATVPVPLPLVILARWLVFRVEFGAGMIKMRGDRCWRDLTCLDHHHETQPMPNPLSWRFHHLAKRVHRLEVLGNHVAQLVMPFLLFLPPPFPVIGGAAIAGTQSWLLLSGNFAWLNWTTIVVTVFAFDDATLGGVLPLDAAAGPHAFPFDVLVVLYTALVLFLSYRPARNLVARRQLMNASFDPLHLVNTYGAFGSVTKERYEVVIEGTADAVLTGATEWREYEFKGKPGDVRYRPRQFAPYHLRLDWLMWFAAMGPAIYYEWFVPLLARLLAADRPTLRLLRHDPFDGRPPRFVRARLYLYRYTTPAERRATGAWWARTPAGEYVRPLSLRSFSP
ncbi:MAG TPA: lipase maturation factor family protein [Candidatus Limnocylindria bacterium]|nr:lipase maturation factor family protein [Candidatus Limnocylindria bacterium]